jgi:glycerol-3-phosphate acyltransferase PlsY
MDDLLNNWPVLLAAYMLGSIPFGLILTRIAGLGDIRSIGSGNIGATNVLRTGKRALALCTLLLDALKGTVAVLLAKYIDAEVPAVAALAGVLALLGHMYPVWLRFKGGKGVATALGIWLGLSAPVFACMAAAWALAAWASRTSSVGALAMIVAAPVAANFIAPDYIPVAYITLALVLWRHRANIERLRHGTEPKIGDK